MSSNVLLRALSPSIRDEIRSRMDRIALPIKLSLEEQGKPIEYVYFIERGVVSRVVTTGPESIEIGITGAEGFIGATVAQGWHSSLNESFVQVTGEALRMPVHAFKDYLSAIPAFRELVLRFSLAQSFQAAHTCLANGRFSILERAARWILMCHDRVNKDDVQLTHEFMALMLGVRRAGVTSEMHTLEGERAIRNRRGLVTVRDRARLEDIAGDAYGASEAIYAELIGTDFRSISSSSGHLGD